MGLLDWWRERGRDLALYPRDENGDVLWGMACKGDDLARARKMDFFFVFPQQESARQFCEHAQQQGFEVSLSWFEEKRAWDAQCSLTLVPTHARVTEVERALEAVAARLDGRADGWGSFAQ